MVWVWVVLVVVVTEKRRKRGSRKGKNILYLMGTNHVAFFFSLFTWKTRNKTFVQLWEREGSDVYYNTSSREGRKWVEKERRIGPNINSYKIPTGLLDIPHVVKCNGLIKGQECCVRNKWLVEEDCECKNVINEYSTYFSFLCLLE